MRFPLLTMVVLLCFLDASAYAQAQNSPPAPAPAIAQNTAPVDNPAAFLQWSIAHYAALKTFRADCTWTFPLEGYADVGQSDQRTIAYATPNRFSVTQSSANGALKFDYICDGKQMVILNKGYGTPAQHFPAPSSFADAQSNGIMSYPFFGGSALYYFFAGPEGLPRLLAKADARNAHHPPVLLAFGPDVTLDGELCKTVIFGGGAYNSERRVSISLRDGFVRRLQGMNIPHRLTQAELARQKKDIQTFLKSAHTKNIPQQVRAQMMHLPASLPASTTTELYSNVVADQPLSATEFDIPAQKSPL